MYIPYVILSFVLFVVHDLFAKYTLNEKAQWYRLHAIVNAVIVYQTYDVVFQALLVNDLNNLELASPIPSIIVFTLHIYHMICYQCNQLDYLHHIVMLSILTFPIYYGKTCYLVISNFCLFFTCGLPGGIDYYLMYLKETGNFSSLAEKKWNVRLNTWIRAPGIMYGAFLTYQHWLSIQSETLIHLATCLALLWNAQYFSMLVSIAYGAAITRL